MKYNGAGKKGSTVSKMEDTRRTFNILSGKLEENYAKVLQQNQQPRLQIKLKLYKNIVNFPLKRSI